MPHSAFLAWSQDDRDKALAYRRAMSEVCPGCGTRDADWATNPDAFVGDFFTCPGCLRLEEERDNVPDGAKGVHYRLIPQAEALAKLENDKSTFVRDTPQDDEA